MHVLLVMDGTVSEGTCLNVSYSQNGPKCAKKWTKINGQYFPLESVSTVENFFLWIFIRRLNFNASRVPILRNQFIVGRISIIKRTLSLVYSHILSGIDKETGSEEHLLL